MIYFSDAQERMPVTLRRLHVTLHTGFLLAGLLWLLFLWAICALNLPPQVSKSHPEAGEGRTFVIVATGLLMWAALYTFVVVVRGAVVKRFRFSSRTLLVIFTIVCIGFGLFGRTSLSWLGRTRAKYNALTKFYSIGGVSLRGSPSDFAKAELSNEILITLYGASSEPGALVPFWILANYLRFFDEDLEIEAAMANTRLDAATLAEIAVGLHKVRGIEIPVGMNGTEFIALSPELPNLERLALRAAEVSDFDPKQLAKFPKLKKLQIMGSTIPWECYQAIRVHYPRLAFEVDYTSGLGRADFEDFRAIRLAGPMFGGLSHWIEGHKGQETEIFVRTLNRPALDAAKWLFAVDKVNAILARHPEIECVEVDEWVQSAPDDDSFSVIMQLKRLTSLRITTDDIKQIAERQELKELILSCPNATDADFALFRSHPSLEELIINSANITDASEEVLTSIPRLRKIELRSTKMTSAAIDRVKQRIQPMADDDGNQILE